MRREFADHRREAAWRRLDEADEHVPGRVGHQDASFEAFRAQRHSKEGCTKVDVIDNEIRHQPVFGQLLPDVIGMAAQQLVRPVAEVSGEGGAG